MSTRTKLIIGGLVLIQAVLIVAIIGALRPASFGFNVPFAPWSFGVGGVEARAAVEEQTINVSESPEIRITNDTGTVELSTGVAGVVTVSGERFARGSTRAQAEDRLSGVVPTVRKVGNRVEIEARVASRWKPQDRIDLVVEVPEKSQVTVNASMGRVTAAGLSGDLKLDASMGSARVRDMTGNLEIDAGMGEINVINANITDRLRLDAGMGSVEFSGVPGADNRLNAGMGSIRIDLPPDSVLDLIVDVGMGSFNSDLPLDGSRKNNSFRGQLGTGDPTGTMEVDAGMGSVRIRPLQ